METKDSENLAEAVKLLKKISRQLEVAGYVAKDE
jgi:hypothetical protein